MRKRTLIFAAQIFKKICNNCVFMYSKSYVVLHVFSILRHIRCRVIYFYAQTAGNEDEIFVMSNILQMFLKSI